jgi:two-component system, NarL family, sensor kinase
MKKIIFISLLFFVPAINIIAQSRQMVDSLVRVSREMKNDTIKVSVLSDLCFYYRGISSDSAMLFGKQALGLAENLKWEKGIAQAYNDIAIIHMDKNEYDAAIILLNKSLELRKKLGDKLGEAAVYNKLGIIYQEKFQLNEALKYNYKALDIYEKLEHKYYLGFVLNNIGVLHFNLREYEKAIEIQNRALAYRKETGDKYGVAASYGNLGNVYYESRDTLKAIENWEFSIAEFRQMNKPGELSSVLNNLGGLLVVRKEYRKAIPMLQESYQIRKQLNDKKAISSVLISLGEAQMMTGNYYNASISLHEALRLSRSINTRHEILFAYMKLAQLNVYKGESDSAYYYMEQYSLLKDSVFNEDLQGQVAEMRTRYETEKKEKELLEEKALNANLTLEKTEAELSASNRKKWIFGISGGAVAIVFIVLFIMQRKSRKLQADKDAEIIRERESGIKAVITSTEEERKRIARELHDGIGQQLGGLKLAMQKFSNDFAKENDTQKNKLLEITRILDEAATEVRSISHQMMPKVLSELGLVPAIEDMLKKTFGQTDVKYEFETFGITERFHDSIEISLYRICQELVNNIIKHSGANHVTVQLFKNKNHLILIVEDNGKGFDFDSKKEGIGLMNITSRLSTIQGEVYYEPSPVSGTLATIRVPV